VVTFLLFHLSVTHAQVLLPKSFPTVPSSEVVKSFSPPLSKTEIELFDEIPLEEEDKKRMKWKLNLKKTVSFRQLNCPRYTRVLGRLDNTVTVHPERAEASGKCSFQKNEFNGYATFDSEMRLLETYSYFASQTPAPSLLSDYLTIAIFKKVGEVPHHLFFGHDEDVYRQLKRLEKKKKKFYVTFFENKNGVKRYSVYIDDDFSLLSGKFTGSSQVHFSVSSPNDEIEVSAVYTPYMRFPYIDCVSPYFKKGKLQSCILASNYSIGEIRIPKLSKVRFHPVSPGKRPIPIVVYLSQRIHTENETYHIGERIKVENGRLRRFSTEELASLDSPDSL